MNPTGSNLATFDRVDWLAFGRENRLHCPIRLLCYDDTDRLTYGFTFACGRSTPVASSTRMFTRRCAQCCAQTCLPRGYGSPKNDPECRRILGLDGEPG